MQETFTESLTSQNLDLHDFHDVSHWDVLLHQNSCMYFFFFFENLQVTDTRVLRTMFGHNSSGTS